MERGLPSGEGRRAVHKVHSPAFAVLIPSLPVSTMKAAEKSFQGLALSGKLTLCTLELAFKCVWFGLLSVLKATQTDTSPTVFNKRFRKSGHTLLLVRHPKG